MEKREIWEALCNRHSTAVQKKLDKAKVAVAGLGGLGSNIAVSLARIGVGHLHLLDFDEVDLTNLNRQYYFTRHIGMKKTEALKEILSFSAFRHDRKSSCSGSFQLLMTIIPLNPSA